MKDRRDATLEKHCYLRNFVNHVVMKECDPKNTFQKSRATSFWKKFTQARVSAHRSVMGMFLKFFFKFAEMPPIFKNVEIPKQDVGPYMTAVCKKLDEFKMPHRSLIGSFFRKQIMLATPLLQWYLKHGLVIKNITAFICYEPVLCFKEFTDEVANAR